MEVEDAIRSRRTHKAFAPEPVPRELLDELLELARWAPNHHLTNPWRFRVLGPTALAALKQAAGPEGGEQARPRADTDRGDGARAPKTPCRTRRICARPRAPPTRCCSPPTGAGSRATGAPRACSAPSTGRHALGIPPDERFVALIHLGWPRQEKEPPERAPQSAVVSYLS